jgi:hypothetical protein
MADQRRAIDIQQHPSFAEMVSRRFVHHRSTQ